MTDRTTGGIPRTFMRDFIALYRTFPCLWNPKARDFNYRSSKAQAYNVLVSKYREAEPSASKETVQQRISSLRNCRRKELKKVKQAQAVGEVYTPQLWYYSLMSFIDDTEDSDENMPPLKQGAIEENHHFDDSCYAPDSPAPSQDSNGTGEIDRSFKQTKRRREDADEEEDEELMRYLKQRIRGQKNTPPAGPAIATPLPSTYHHLAMHWADKMVSLRSEQRIYAEKLINDVFFEAEFVKLGHGCHIVNSTQER